MTRRDATAEQERLFPRQLWRLYTDTDTPHPDNLFRQIPPTLPDICLRLRAAMTGAADPWDPVDVRAVLAMLRLRLGTWEQNVWLARWAESFCRADVLIDQAVNDMVSATVAMAESWLANQEDEQERHTGAPS